MACAVRASLADGILTQDEEARPREFQDQFAVAAPKDAEAALKLGARDRVTLDARLIAVSAGSGKSEMQELGGSVRELGLSSSEERQLLALAWEAAVEGSLEDGVLSLDEVAALLRYLFRFGLSVADVDRNRAHRNMVMSATIRELAGASYRTAYRQTSATHST